MKRQKNTVLISLALAASILCLAGGILTAAMASASFKNTLGAVYEADPAAARQFADALLSGRRGNGLEAAEALGLTSRFFVYADQEIFGGLWPVLLGALALLPAAAVWLYLRREKVKPLLDKAYEIINTLRPGKGSNLGTAVTYAKNQKDKLYLFLDDAKVEMSNNLAERTVKPYVINRKNFLFSDTEKGAGASAAVMSIIETAKRNELDVYGYLLYLLTVLPKWGADPTETQLKSVMHWSMALPPYCKQTYSEVK